MSYISIETLLSSESIEKPKTLDCLTFEYEGVTFYIYGVLHAITGGTNLEYKKLVNDTIATAPGYKMCEKSMMKMYKGLDEEVEDWLQVPPKDVFKLALRLVSSPFIWYDIIKTIIIENTTKKDKFGLNQVKRIQDIGGSAYFHALDPFSRRKLMGFPESAHYLQINKERRSGINKLSSLYFPDPDWKWLTAIEPYVDIPYRSIHMIEFALETAKRKKMKTVSIFVAETHNTDIYFCTHSTKNEEIKKEVREVIDNYFKQTKTSRFMQKLKYLGFSALGAMIPIGIVTALFIYFKLY